MTRSRAPPADRAATTTTGPTHNRKTVAVENIQPFGDLTEEEYEALKASIAEHGLLSPITKDQNGTVLDGNHRLRACRELDIQPRYEIVVCDNDDDRYVRAVVMNLLRRHLTRDQKSEKVTELRSRGWTYERIAAETGIPETTGRRMVAESENVRHLADVDTESAQQPRTVIDSLGRVQPARKPRTERHADVPVWGSPEARTADVIRCWAEEPHIAARTTFEDVGGCPYCLHTPEERQAMLKARATLKRRMQQPTIITAKDEREAERAQKAMAQMAEPFESGTLTANEAIRAAARQRVPEAVPEPVKPPEGKFSCIVIDPPWPMQKIEREERPNQGIQLDYPVMSLEQIADENLVPVRTLAADNAHIYLWVTHKFLPAGMDLLNAWGFRYQCVMTWRKNVGITPFSWMYDTEHVLFGRRGDLKLQRLGLRLSFEAPVQGHSAKPDVFYERVTQATPGPRVEMFARRPREGFTVWGNEVTHVV